MPESAYGMAGAGGGTRLGRQIPQTAALWLALTGEPIDAEEARRSGGDVGGENEDAEHEDGVPHSPAAEGGEEGGAVGEAEGVDEEGEAREVGLLGQAERRVEGAEGEAGEEHRREAETGRLPRGVAHRRHREEEEERIPGQESDHPLHGRWGGAPPGPVPGGAGRTVLPSDPGSPRDGIAGFAGSGP